MKNNDYTAIKALLFTYAEYVDKANFEAVGELLDGAKLGSGGQFVDATAEFVKSLYGSSNRVHADGTLKTRHVTTNVKISPGQDSRHAEAESYYMVLQATEKLPLQPVVAGRYADQFEKHGDQWRFSRREVHVDLVGDVTEHLVNADLQVTAADTQLDK